MSKSRKYIIGTGIITFLIAGYFIADIILFNRVKPRTINENGFQANYFVKTDTKRKAAIVLIGGGQWGDYWGQQFANRGYSGLSLPYTR
ncbi:MAG: palmitoyl-CoA hydrolase, partial [Bacteroidetes bacterium]|nr:palmitoyl-CoA hydrolase [Bacteroidota bacterium]